ncbi:TPA: hypothetical protein DDX30_03430 [Candidatus Wolfebacteria bacterium]|nr:hypothetical protein [Candidatus Wolfebacteria bacterium]
MLGFLVLRRLRFLVTYFFLEKSTQKITNQKYFGVASKTAEARNSHARVGALKHRASSDIFPAPLIRNILMLVSRITRIGVLFYSLANEGVGFFN